MVKHYVMGVVVLLAIAGASGVAPPRHAENTSDRPILTSTPTTESSAGERPATFLLPWH
jgi:hypothetical protein